MDLGVAPTIRSNYPDVNKSRLHWQGTPTVRPHCENAVIVQTHSSKLHIHMQQFSYPHSLIHNTKCIGYLYLNFRKSLPGSPGVSQGLPKLAVATNYFQTSLRKSYEFARLLNKLKRWRICGCLQQCGAHNNCPRQNPEPI